MKGITTGRLVSLSAFMLAAGGMFKGGANRVYSLLNRPDNIVKTHGNGHSRRTSKSFGGSVSRDKRAAKKARNVHKNKMHHRGHA